MNQASNQPSNSTSAGASNWHIDDLSHQNRLAEDLELLQANFKRMPPSPETTAGAAQKKGKGPANQQTPCQPMDNQAVPPHMDPWLPKAPQLQAKRAEEVTATAQFRSVNILKADGSNFGDWYRNLAEVARANLKTARFFFEECDNTTYERIGRAVIIASVDHSLVAEMQSLHTCHAMHNSLLGKFKTSSRAAQMNIFYKFRTFLVDPDSPNAGIASTLKDMYAEWLAIGLKFGINSFLGFILQAAVMDSSAPYKTAFELRVEQIVQNDPAGKCPTFENIMKQLDICKDQHKHL
ncbi:hypothetical protein PTTG_30769, partial [Puccinia triticina 1-1 BBBD Race 1]